MVNSKCKKLNINYSCLTDKGSEKNNEDSVFCVQKNEDYLFAVADGLGGHGKGEMASLAAVTISAAIFDSKSKNGYELLFSCFETSQEIILNMQKESNEKDSYKSTLVLLSISNDNAMWGHIGDSRLYMFRSGEIIMRTYDHSVPQILCLTGDISQDEIRHHADRNKLINVLGSNWDVPKYELIDKGIKIKKGDAFLLCTDGFWEWITEEKMTNCILKCSSPDECLDLMEKEILENAESTNMDNYSAVLLMIE